MMVDSLCMQALHFTNNTGLGNNSASSGGAIKAKISTLIFSGNNTFKSNSPNWGGGVDAEFATNLILDGVVVIVKNSTLW